ncbi:MAG: Hpt domain-containing protein, partial [Acholeplasmataceae bacterium]|nr:Hpt domain-containing protein [Acholeplasmataceae bacterium]
AVYDQDFAQILRSAHYLKGSASYVSGDRVVWILNQMMDQAKVKEQAFINPYYDLLSDEMQTLHDSLQTHLKQLMKANG